jgi:putative transposase
VCVHAKGMKEAWCLAARRVSEFPCTGHNLGTEGGPLMARRKQPSIPDDVLDRLLAGGDPRDTLAGKDGLLDALKKALAERALNAEMDHHLETGEPDGRANSRNGYGRKTVLTDSGRMAIEVPRDRLATFDPQLIAKYRRRLPGFDDKVVSLSPLPEATAAGHGMYARGLSVREIQGHLLDLYSIEVSPDLISAVTDAVLDEVTQWQERPLEPVYPLVFFDALRVKVRDEGTVRNKAVHVALGVRLDGTKEILGLWIEQSEGAKFWLRVMTELKNRGVEDVMIAVVDGLKGFPEAITAVFPQTQVQTCIVHLIRGSLKCVPWKDRKAVAAALKAIYRATDADAGRTALDAFAEGPWGVKYPAIAPSWRRNWAAVIPFFAFPEDVRRIIYTTNAIESLNAKLRRAVRARGHFPTDDSVLKLLFLVLNLAAKDWKMPPREWGMAKAQFAILFEDRFTLD